MRSVRSVRSVTRGALAMLVATALGAGCSTSSTAPEPALSASQVDRLVVFARNWPNEYVEVDYRRSGSGGTLVVFRPPQPGAPRIVLDSIGPTTEHPAEIVDLMRTFDVWALADSNAAGAACSTRSGAWVCHPTADDYSVVVYVVRGGTARSQRYTRLESSGGHRAARALGDYVFALSRRRTAVTATTRHHTSALQGDIE